VLDHVFGCAATQAFVAQQIQSFKEFPPRQKPASFNLDRVLEQLKDASGGGQH
jgi:arylsulfatase